MAQDVKKLQGRTNHLITWRFIKNRLMTVFAFSTILVMLCILISVLITLFINGLSGLSFFTLTHMTAPQGLPGGLLNPILGSMIQVGIAIIIAVPTGILGGIFLAECSNKKLSTIIRFIADIMMSVPSILIGLFVYILLVMTMGYSALAGSVALALLALPVIARTTEEALNMVPSAIHEAGFALGAPKWKVILFICLPAAKGGIITGILLSISRMAGETAPLLFTSLGNSDWSWNILKPMASLPLTIYQYADSADDTWIKLAWTAALLITFFVLCLNLIARIYVDRHRKKD
ncbi:ABC-type phosphate transport system [Commensalibacter communis]|uniref:Phosphate transport system permease protein PstA n=1 Tax=Commensalibacter communis TaxID=2972786 RepID=A0A9W4TRC9_9PROT|nr:phosphate ABC transporter permease PstA [Commensalibacter communis]CAI3954121.1 ABC-type phosphate transport system [Commensalibacter communis]CAI3956054.1 ABC-type phosphate transport system [Commensalibacter communis]CAI3956280.1 ABC-type phosphate transport system [Commensalibacter communis]CAI3956443.1 ABC-type phosphate transport system [Commensalibacter communis]CAI3957222.1 ABC-type phosphate transport system [Commensalibacter communis]